MKSKKPDFSWDAYLDSETYNHVLDGMRPARELIPTMFSPDKKSLFLRSDGLCVETNDLTTLRNLLESKYRDLKSEYQQMKVSCEKLYHLQVDFLILWRLLANNEALEEAWMDPDALLEIAFGRHAESDLPE